MVNTFGQIPSLPEGYQKIEFPGSDYTHVIKEGKMGLMQLDSSHTKWMELMPPKYDLIIDLPGNYYKLVLVVEDGVLYPYDVSIQYQLPHQANKSLTFYDVIDSYESGIIINDTLVLSQGGTDTITYRKTDYAQFYGYEYETEKLKVELLDENSALIAVKHFDYYPALKSVLYPEEDSIDARGKVVYPEKNDFTGVLNLSTYEWLVKPEYDGLKIVPEGILTYTVSKQTTIGYDEYEEWMYEKSESYKIGLINAQYQTVLEPKTVDQFTKEDSLAFLPKGAQIFDNDNYGNIYYRRNGKMGAIRMDLEHLNIESIVPEQYEFVMYISPIQRYIGYGSNTIHEYRKNEFGQFIRSTQVNAKTAYEYKISDKNYLEVDGDHRYFGIQNEREEVIGWEKSPNSINQSIVSVYGLHKINKEQLLVNNGPINEAFVAMTSNVYPEEDSIDDEGNVVYYPRNQKISRLYSLKTKQWLDMDYKGMFKTMNGFICTKSGENDPVFGVISNDFKEIIPFQFLEITEQDGMYIAAAQYGLSAYNKEGQLVVKPDGYSFIYFKDGFSLFRVKERRKAVVMDMSKMLKDVTCISKKCY